MITIESPIGNFRWIENWISIPESPLGRTNGRTHGVAVLKNGEIVIFHQADPAVLFYSPVGELLRSWGNFPGAHGLTVVEEGGVEYLWLADQATKEVVKTSLEGDIVSRITQPDHSAYQDGAYTPTWVAIAEERFGGNGEIWVADGYGCSLVHRFAKDGEYIGTLDGTEGSGRFKCPHGLALDTRSPEPEFYIADRGNRQFQVYGMDGVHRRTFGAESLNSPDVSVQMGAYLIVPELVSGLTILDSADRPVATLGFQSDANRLEGWPNERGLIREGLFNSPHSAASDAEGNIFVVEWITGGRVTKLERL